MMLLLIRDDPPNHPHGSSIVPRKIIELMFKMFQHHAFHGFGRQRDGSPAEQACDNPKSEAPKAA